MSAMKQLLEQLETKADRQEKALEQTRSQIREMQKHLSAEKPTR